VGRDRLAQAGRTDDYGGKLKIVAAVRAGHVNLPVPVGAKGEAEKVADALLDRLLQRLRGAAFNRLII
jgi:hypothetical protein